MHEIWKEFRFDSAHYLLGGPPEDERYRRVHGHSYHAQIWLRGEINEHGWVVDMGQVNILVADVIDKIDHRLLNDVPELGAPTMENLAAYIWRHLSHIKQLHKVVVRCDAAGEGAVYYGSSKVEAKSPSKNLFRTMEPAIA